MVILGSSECRIACGLYHSLVVDEPQREEDGVYSNVVYGFGSNRNHMLGLLEKEVYTTPKDIAFFNDKLVLAVACGDSFSVFLEKLRDQEGGTVWVVGLGTAGRLGVDRPLSREEYETLLVDSGYDDEEIDALVEKAGSLLDKWRVGKGSWSIPVPVCIRELENVISVSCGADHTLALTEAGEVYAWGQGSFGNLGTGSTDDLARPGKIRMPDDVSFSMVAAGTKHSLGLTKESGVMYSWGHGGNGRLGQGDRREASLVPGRVMVEARAAATRWIAAGEAHSACIDVLGNVFCWGAGTRGRTGHGEEIDYPVPKQVRSLGGTSCTIVALGAVHSLALAQVGTLHSWGTGFATGHEAAVGTEPVQPTPQEITSPELQRARVVHVAAGAFHSLALQEHGEILSWGSGSQGRLGLGEMRLNDRDAPELVNLHGVDAQVDYDEQREVAATADQHQICCGGMHSAFVTGGEVWLWGSNEYGQLGAGDKLDRSLPLRLQSKEISMTKTTVESVAMGLEHCLLLTTPSAGGGRLLFSWGRNHAGQLGLGNNSDSRTPQQVSSIMDARHIAVGEDHSAAILSSGELYTWGSAENGKLGHGSTGGSQNYPRLVRMSDQLAHVSCGAQHTALLNVQGHLFTFGAGWFGRLGHGDSSNRSAPKQVERFEVAEARGGTGPSSGGSPSALSDAQAPRVEDVQCGAYHTCIVTAGGQLWVCGRDTMICEQDHVHRPIRFNWGASGPRMEPRVRAVAAGSGHTLCLTDTGSLWVWGENGKGQLGLGPGASSRLHSPAQVSLAGWAAAGLAGIAAGHAHSVALLSSGEVYAWGYSAGGRLGLEVETGSSPGPRPRPARVAAAWNELHEQLDEPAEPKPAAPALAVAAEAAGAEPSGATAAPDAAVGAADAAEIVDPAGDYGVLSKLQSKLQHEQPDRKPQQLHLMEERLSNELQGFYRDICGLWLPPKPGDTTEWEMDQLRGRLDRSLCQNLRRLGLSDEYPNLDDLQLPHWVSQVLVYYEELLWVLQQQPCYLARLSQIRKHHHERHQALDGTRMMDIYLKAVQQIFREMGDPRIRHHFMALIRRVVTLEIQRPAVGEEPRTGDWMLDAKASRVYPLLDIFVQHPYFKDLHRAFFDIDVEDSLIMKLSHWTIRQGKASEVAIFALEVAELAAWEHAGDEHLMSEKERAEQLAHLRSRLQEHQKVMHEFLGTCSSHARPNTFVSFLEKLHVGEAVQSILVKAAECIRHCLQGQPEAKGDKGSGDSRVYEPLMRLLMSSVFGTLLEKHESIMTAQMLSEKFKKKIRGIVEGVLMREQGAVDESEVDEALQDAVRRMNFNLCQLGKFLVIAAKKEFKAGQGNLQTFAAQLTGKFMSFAQRQVESGTDDLGVQLTVDLYTSHFDSAEHFVMMKTSELLHLSNALWHHAERVVETERPKEDRLYQLLDLIQPPAKGADDRRLWTPDMIRSVEAQDMRHNFTVCHRFLQLHPKADICFCRASEVPVPRILAQEGQRQERGRELLRIYPDFLEETDIGDLGRVIANRDLGVDLREAKTFATLHLKLEEAQKAINQRMRGSEDVKSADDYARLTEIERGKRALERLRAGDFTIHSLADCLIDHLKAREQHCRYLQKLQDRQQEMVDHRQKYFKQLKDQTEVLRRFVQASEKVTVPSLLRNKASDNGVRLRLTEVERLRQREEKHDKDFADEEAPAEIYASATFSLFNLRAKKVVRRMGGDLPQKEHRNILFTFNHVASGNWEIVAVHQDRWNKSHMLCTFEITVQDIERMKKAGKSEKREFNDGFVVMSCFSLLQLLARIRALPFKG